MTETARSPQRLTSRRLDIRQQRESATCQAAEKVFAGAGFGGATMQLIADCFNPAARQYRRFGAGNRRS